LLAITRLSPGPRSFSSTHSCLVSISWTGPLFVSRRCAKGSSSPCSSSLVPFFFSFQFCIVAYCTKNVQTCRGTCQSTTSWDCSRAPRRRSSRAPRMACWKVRPPKWLQPQRRLARKRKARPSRPWPPSPLGSPHKRRRLFRSLPLISSKPCPNRSSRLLCMFL